MTKVALITGAAKGIGRGIALALAEDGFDVAIHFRSSVTEAEEAAAAARLFDVRAITLHADLGDQRQAENVVLETAKQLGGLDVLVNVVGNYHRAPIESFPVDQWHDMFNTNLHSTFYTCQAAFPWLRKSTAGRIINFGFAGAQHQVVSMHTTAYSIAKAGIVTLTKAIAEQEASNGITANVIAPGVIDTSISQPIDQIPMGRLGTISDIVSAVRYFVSPEASYVTGQCLEVAGGWKL